MKKTVQHSLSWLRNNSVHYTICGLFFLVYNVNELAGDVEFTEMAWPFLALLLGPVLLKFFLTALTGRSINSAIFTTLFCLIIIFYAHLFYFFISSHFVKSFLKEGYFIIFLIGGLALAAFRLFRAAEPQHTFNLYLNLLLLSYLFVEMIRFTGNAGHVDEIRGIMAKLDSVRKPASRTKPNVYFIVTDAYANSENLKKYWNYDNGKFIAHLKQRGFYHVMHSRSNYNNTGSSIASILNAEFLPRSLDVNSTVSRIAVQNGLIRMIRASKVFQRFYAEGYDICNLSIFNILNTRPFYFDRFLYPSFYNHLLSKTLPIRIFIRYADMDRLAALGEMERISKVKDVRPRLIYCHLLLPHHPYVYDSTGAHSIPTNPSFRQSLPYLEQLIYTNKLLTRSIDGILNNDPHAVIVLTSDHGYRQLDKEEDSMKESFENFTCFHFPGRDTVGLYDTMSAINIFNIVFSKIEGEPLKLQKDTLNYFY